MKTNTAVWWSLVGAALPWLVEATIYGWWRAWGSPTGGDVLWYGVVALVPSFVLGFVIFAIASTLAGRHWRDGHLSSSSQAILALAGTILAADVWYLGSALYAATK